MRATWALPGALAVLPAVFGLASNNAPQGGSTFSLSADQDLFTFEYTTDHVDETNWIAIYNAEYGGPVNEELISPALVWDYAPEQAGSVHLATDNLSPGRYAAYFMAKDGWEWLAEPFNVDLPDETGTVPDTASEFMVHKAVLPNARQGQEYSQSIAGLVRSVGFDADVRQLEFTSSSYTWVQVSSDGILSGTPGPNDEDTTVTVQFSDDGSNSDEAEFTIPVRSSDKPLLDSVAVMSFNLWHGGTRVNGFQHKQVAFILASGADVVGIQEDQNGQHTTRLGEALGWHYWNSTESDLGVLSKYPIVEEYGVINASGGVRIALDGTEQQINLWNVHLGYDPYGPYDFCFDHMSVEEVMQREAESGRTPQIADTLEAMEEQLDKADEVPVLLLGDFNAPSHLDWVPELREKNCGQADIEWPTSILPVRMGLIDSYREAHPDPAEEQGITWSPIFPFNDERELPEPQDRIDFTYHKGDLGVISSEALIVGEPKDIPNHEDNEWTSDHAVVLTVYDLKK